MRALLALWFFFATSSAYAQAWHGPAAVPETKKAAPETPAAPAAPKGPAVRRFEPPTVQGLVVDRCESWSTNCGDGGAKAFCRLRGYARLVRYEHAKPGRTWVIGSARSCDGDFCTGYSYVECADLLPLASKEVTRFEPALYNGIAVDNCVSWSTNCGGEPGATAFCRAQGFARALQWEFNRPGRTWVLGSNRECKGDLCVGYAYVVCTSAPR